MRTSARTLANAGTVADVWQVKNDDERITLIRNAVFESVTDPLAVWVARKIVADCPSRNEDCELRALYKAVKHGPIPIPTDKGIINAVGLRFIVPGSGEKGLRFMEDSRNIDQYPAAGRILRWLAEGANSEDCDGHTILIDTLALIMGFQTGAMIASRDGTNYVHVFPLVGIPKGQPTRWLPMDTTVPEAYPGWMPPQSYGVKAMKAYAIQPGKVKGRRIL